MVRFISYPFLFRPKAFGKSQRDPDAGSCLYNGGVAHPQADIVGGACQGLRTGFLFNESFHLFGLSRTGCLHFKLRFGGHKHQIAYHIPKLFPALQLPVIAGDIAWLQQADTSIDIPEDALGTVCTDSQFPLAVIVKGIRLLQASHPPCPGNGYFIACIIVCKHYAGGKVKLHLIAPIPLEVFQLCVFYGAFRILPPCIQFNANRFPLQGFQLFVEFRHHMVFLPTDNKACVAGGKFSGMRGRDEILHPGIVQLPCGYQKITVCPVEPPVVLKLLRGQVISI